jgi:RNA polymerase sigma-70 factor (ECF subfamily)
VELTILDQTDTPQNLSKFCDEELLQLSRNRDYSAFEELVRRYEGRIYRLGLKMLKSPDDAEDILQKTFLSVFENLDSFRGESKFSTWVFRIAANHALMKLRREKGITIDSLDAPPSPGEIGLSSRIADENCNIHKQFERKEFAEHLGQALSELPEIYRLVFMLRDVEGFSNKETAQMLGIGVPAVKSRLLRARLFLREKLTKIGTGVEISE